MAKKQNSKIFKTPKKSARAAKDSELASIFIPEVDSLARGTSRSKATKSKKSTKNEFRRTMHVVVAYENNAVRRQLASLFRDQDGNLPVSLSLAGSTAEALALYERIHPDLILCQLDLPPPESASTSTFSGREVCEAVRQFDGTRHTGFIFLSARADRRGEADALAMECLSAGADDILSPNASEEILMARIRTVLRFKTMTDELRSANHRLKLLSLTDDLTGLPNMRCFNQEFIHGVRDCREGKTGLAVLMLDLDHFKNVNDTSNHLVGSFVLSSAGKLMRSIDCLSPNDVIARYGGDEFIMMLPVADPYVAAAKGEAVRKAIESAVFTHDGVNVRLTASIGIAWTAKGFEGRADDLVKAADLMLYRSKEHGRNQVSTMQLKYPINFEKIGKVHVLELEKDERILTLLKTS